MPYEIRKRACTDSKGRKGSYVVVEKKTGEEVACCPTREDAEEAMRARYAHEKDARASATRTAPGFFRAVGGACAIAAKIEPPGTDNTDPSRVIEPGKQAAELRPFTMCAYTGGDMDMWFGKLAVDIEGMDVAAGAFPALAHHDPTQIAGFHESVDKGPKGQGPVTTKGRLSLATDAGKLVAALSDEKFPWQASGGWRVSEYEEVGDGETAEVNGREFKGPGLIARKSMLAEASFVPLGADPKTSAIAAGASGAPEVEVKRKPKKTAKGKGRAMGAKASDESEEERKKRETDEEADAEDGDGDEGEGGREEAKAASVKQLMAEFPGESEFVLDQAAKGATMNAARAAYNKVLKAKLAAAEKGRASAASASIRQPVAIGPGVGQASPALTASGRKAPAAARYTEALRAFQAQGMTLQAARKALSIEMPEIQAAYVREANADNPRQPTSAEPWSHMSMPTASGALIRQ